MCVCMFEMFLLIPMAHYFIACIEGFIIPFFPPSERKREREKVRALVLQFHFRKNRIGSSNFWFIHPVYFVDYAGILHHSTMRFCSQFVSAHAQARIASVWFIRASWKNWLRKIIFFFSFFFSSNGTECEWQQNCTKITLWPDRWWIVVEAEIQRKKNQQICYSLYSFPFSLFPLFSRSNCVVWFESFICSLVRIHSYQFHSLTAFSFGNLIRWRTIRQVKLLQNKLNVENRRI